MSSLFPPKIAVRRDSGSWLPQPFSFHPWVGVGGTSLFPLLMVPFTERVGDPLPPWAAGVLPLAALPHSLGSEISVEGVGAQYWPQVLGLALSRTNPSLWRGVAPGASLGMCSRRGIVEHRQDWAFPPPLGDTSRHRQTPKSRYHGAGAGVPFRKHRAGRPRAIPVWKQWRGCVFSRGLHASLGRGR